MGWHPTTVVQCIFTHKLYTEYRGRNTHNNYKEKNWEVIILKGHTPHLCAACLTLNGNINKLSVLSLLNLLLWRPPTYLFPILPSVHTKQAIFSSIIWGHNTTDSPKLLLLLFHFLFSGEFFFLGCCGTRGAHFTVRTLTTVSTRKVLKKKQSV
jgi:hypothetical protein